MVEAQLHLHCLAARLLRQERDLHSVRQREPLRPGLEVGRRRLERFAGDDAGVALVVLDHRGNVDRGRRRRAVGLGVGDELTQRAVGGFEVFERDPLHLGRGQLAPAVTLEEEEPPVAERDCCRQRDPEPLRIVERLIELA